METSSIDKHLLTLTSNRTNQSKITLLTASITLTILLIILGLICFLFILYKRKRLSKLNHYKITNTTNNTTKLSNHLQWTDCSTISYTILRCLTLNKHKTNQKLFNSFNLNDIHSPPPGSGGSLSLNLQSIFTSHPIDLVTTTPPTTATAITTIATTTLCEFTGYTNPTINNNTINNNLLYSQSNDEIRNFTNIEQYGSLRNNTIRSEINPNYSSDSPNTTLCINDNYKGSKLNRVGSISLGYHHSFQLNSPSSPSVLYGSNCMKSGQIDLNITNTNNSNINNNGIGPLGSLKSVSTMGSKSVQPLIGIDGMNLTDDSLLSPNSNARCRNLLNSIPSKYEYCV